MNSAATPFNEQSHGPRALGAWLRWTPFLILLMTAIALLALWNQIPDRWPVHWGLNGQPDHWTDKTLLGVFFPLGLGLSACLFFELLAFIIARNLRLRKNEKISPEAARAIAERMVEFLRLMAIAVAVVMGVLSIMLPLLRPARPFGFVAFTFGVLITAIAIGIWRVVKLMRELKAVGNFAGLEGWNGLIYRNPNDPRLWVPKLTGIGYTLNFAHRWAWPLLILMIGLPLMIVLVIVLLMRSA